MLEEQLHRRPPLRQPRGRGFRWCRSRIPAAATVPGPARSHLAVNRERVLAIRPAEDVLMGGASGAGSLLLNTKASQEAACSRAPAAIVPDQEPESHDAGVSRFGENGSHLEATDAAEGHVEQVGGSGRSGNARIGSHLAEVDAAEGLAGHVGGLGGSEFTKNGSHPAAADFSDEPEAVLWRRPPIAPYRIRPSVVRGGLAGQFGTENGPVVYARFILAPGPHAAVAAAQVRRKAGRSVAGGCVSSPEKSLPMLNNK